MSPKDLVIKVLKNKYFLIAILYLICAVVSRENLGFLTIAVIASFLCKNDGSKSDVYGGDSDCGCGHDCGGHHGDGCD